MAPEPDNQRLAAVRVVTRLRDAGHTAYFAGGCVRDELLGRRPADYDVATDARPEQVRELFKGSRFVGEAFGVVLVRMRPRPSRRGQPKQPAYQIEVATFRREAGYADGRHPSHVSFTDAEHDAQRRDFTVNGLFEDPLTEGDDASRDEDVARADDGSAIGFRLGRVIDFVGGVDDLKRRVIRAIGEPDQRFGEDFLRMLRAVRFAVRLGFRLDPATAGAIRRHAHMLGGISRERIGQEVTGMLTGPHPPRCARLMQRLMLDAPALEEDHAAPPLRIMTRLHRLRRRREEEDDGGSADYPTQLAAWLLDRHWLDESIIASASFDALRDSCGAFIEGEAPAILQRWRNALCLPNEHRDGLRHTLALLPRALNWAALPVAQRKRLLAESRWPAARQVLRAMAFVPVLGAFVDQLQDEAAPLIAAGVAPSRLLTGDDLIALGLTPGPQLGEILEAVYDAQLENTVATKPQAEAWVKQRATGG